MSTWGRKTSCRTRTGEVNEHLGKENFLQNENRMRAGRVLGEERG